MKTKVIGVFILAALSALAGFWGGREVERRRATREARTVADAHRAEVAALRSGALAWADELALREGEAAIQAFVAGVAPAIRTERHENLETSALSLLRIDGITGVHVVAADGRVLYSSDAKNMTTGDAGDAGRWALAAAGAARRDGVREGSSEIAIPVTDGGRTIASVWIEFARDAVRDSARPAGMEAIEAHGESSAPEAGSGDEGGAAGDGSPA